MNEERTKILVAGGGISGVGAAKMLLDTGKGVILYDGNETLSKENLEKQLPGAEIVLGELTDEILSETEACVISPGLPLRAPFV